jgi:hypothetical protein
MIVSTNAQFFDIYQLMKTKKAKLALEPNTNKIVDRCNAASMLNAEVYGRYKLCRRRVSDNVCTTTHTPSATNITTGQS